MKQEILENLLENLENSNKKYLDYDTLDPTHEDYMMYSPYPVGYNTNAEQQFLMRNLLVGYAGGSILDIGSGRSDLYGIARDLADLNNDIALYNAIDHNPIMTQLAERKWGLTGVKTGAFESTKLDPADWVVASGVFTQRRCATEDEDLSKLFSDIDLLYKLSNQVLVFNLLNPINTTHHEGFFYVHPGLVMDMLIEKYQYINIRCNYSPDVYTVLIYKF